MATSFFGSEFFSGEFFQSATPGVAAVTGGAGRSRRRIPRYIFVEPEEEVVMQQEPVVPFEKKVIAVMLPKLTSFEAGLEADYITVRDKGISIKKAPPEWDEDDEWLLIH